jgi:hypothetical protein
MTMGKNAKRAAALGGLLIFGVVGCASQVPLIDESGQNLIGRKAYALYDLHPDRARGRLYTVNYQLAGAIIPLCAEVELLSMNRKVLKFTEIQSGQQFQYLYHKATGEPIEVSAARTFGPSCDPDKVKSMSKVDQEGIQAGIIKKGMTKQGVLLAAGPPPQVGTPNLDAFEWTYWKNRWSTMVVRFDEQGVVTQVSQ